MLSTHFGSDILPSEESDRADAAGLAAAGAYYLGYPSLPPAYYRDATMKKVCWDTTQGPVEAGYTDAFSI